MQIVDAACSERCIIFFFGQQVESPRGPINALLFCIISKSHKVYNWTKKLVVKTVHAFIIIYLIISIWWQSQSYGKIYFSFSMVGSKFSKSHYLSFNQNPNFRYLDFIHRFVQQYLQSWLKMVWFSHFIYNAQEMVDLTKMKNYTNFFIIFFFSF